VGVYTRQSVCAPIRAEEGLLGVLCPPGSPVPYCQLPKGASIGGYPTALQVASLGVDPAALDAEGRCLVVEFPAFVLFGVYSPANSNGLRDDFRSGFLLALDTRIRNLTKMGKNVILTGDLNVSRDLIDTAKAEDNMRSEGMTHDQYLSTPNRRVFNQLLLNGQVPGERDEGREEPMLYDLCREFHPDREGMYTHWEQKINARPGNFGSRIDFVLCSIAIKDWFQDANIQEGLMGSDHCPVYALMKDVVPIIASAHRTPKTTDSQNGAHILDMMNPPGMFIEGVRQRDYSPINDVPLLSGKLLTEFTKRRNIRDMFNKTAVLMKKTPAPTLIEAPLTSIVNAAVLTSEATNVVDKKYMPLDEAFLANAAGNRRIPPTPSLLNSPEKRSAPSTSPAKPVKRSKSGGVSSSGNSTSLDKGQRSLKGFFQTQTKSTDPSSTLAVVSSSSASKDGSDRLPTQPTIQSTSPSSFAGTDPLASQEASKEGWTRLFSQKPPPRCEGHAEPCIILTTKKPGVNCGRQFWMCSRPIGPSGQKENGTQWRCSTFIWASDWKG
jgi:AP endonuclease-2